MISIHGVSCVIKIELMKLEEERMPIFMLGVLIFVTVMAAKNPYATLVTFGSLIALGIGGQAGTPGVDASGETNNLVVPSRWNRNRASASRKSI